MKLHKYNPQLEDGIYGPSASMDESNYGEYVMLSEVMDWFESLLDAECEICVKGARFGIEGCQERADAVIETSARLRDLIASERGKV